MSGLLYQVILLLNDYLNGITVVALNVGLIQMDTLPAFTICTRDIRSVTKAYVYDKKFEPEFVEYKKIIEELARLPKNAASKANETELLKKFQKLLDKIRLSHNFEKFPGIVIHDNPGNTPI